MDCPLPECEAGTVAVCDGVPPVNSCEGFCRCLAATPTATSTATPETTPSATAATGSVAARMRAVIDFAAQLCPRPDSTGPYLTVGCDASSCSFDCSWYSGHAGTASLTRYDSAAAAATVFADIDHPRSDFLGWPASFWTAPFPYPRPEGGSSHHGIFHAGCWLVRADAYDDTHFLIAPQPEQTLQRLHEKALELGLFDACGP